MDKILEVKRELTEKAQQFRQFIDTITKEKRALSDEEKSKIDTMKREISELQTIIQTAEESRALVDSIPPVPPAAAGRAQQPEAPAVIPTRSEDVEPGIGLARYVKASLVSMREGRSFEEVVQRMYPRDQILLASRAAMSTNAPSDGGVFVPDNLSSEIIPLLRQLSVVRSLGARVIPVPNGNLNIPRQTGAANFQWVGQNKPILSSKVTLGMIKLSAKKLAGMIPASNELLRDGSIAADRFIRDELTSGIAESEDITCLYGRGEQDEPIGVLNAKGILSSDMSAFPDGDKIAEMVGQAMSQKFPGTSNFGWMFSGVLWPILYNLKDGSGRYIYREEMNQNKLNGYQFKINNNIKVGTDAHGLTEIYFADWSQFLIGETLGLEIAVSQEASYMDGASLVSAFANDQTVMRALIREDFGIRYPSAFIVNQKVWSK